MSVDTLRETFHINRISTAELEDFLTAQTYRPEVTEARNKVQSLNHVGLQSVCETPIRQGKSPKYVETEGLTCIKPKNTRGLIVELADCDMIDAKTECQVRRQKLEYGDVVITRSGSGTIGRASIFTGDSDVYINDHLFIVRASKADAFYVGAFLKSYWGERLLEAGISGSTGQLNLSNEHIKQIALYHPDPLVQKYIGDKVRQAERLRAWAKQLKGEVDKQIESLELPYDSMPEMINKVAYDTLSDRLDPRPYRTNSLGIVEAIKKIPNSLLSNCVFMSSGCPVSSKDFTEDFDVPLVRIRNIGSYEFSGLDFGVSTAVYQAAIKYSAKPGHVVIGMDGDFRAQFFLEAELPMLINQRVAVFNPKNIRPELLTHWLNRPEGQIQLYQWAVKTTVDHTSLTDLKKVRIPRFESEAEEKLADMLLSARLARYYARKLTMSAKFLVEALIEGAVTELQLINVQKAIDTDDASLDLDILARLTTKGLDGDGDPLFSDLDQLYDLLIKSQSLDE